MRKVLTCICSKTDGTPRDMVVVLSDTSRKAINIKENYITRGSVISNVSHACALSVAAEDPAQEPATTKGYPRLPRARLAQAALSQDNSLRSICLENTLITTIKC